MVKRTDLKSAINTLRLHAPLGLMVAAALASGACGRQIGTVQVQGNPVLTVTVDTEKLEQYFRPYCVELLTAQGDSSPAESDVTACTNTMIANFLAQVQGAPVLPIPSPSPTI